MDRIFFENVRCFSARQESRLAPLTVLVGENSSGKSTFLALVRLAWDLASAHIKPDFNEEPFQLGAYDQIVSDVGSQSEQKKAFTVGMKMCVGLQGGFETAEVTGRFRSYRGQPMLEKWSWDCAPYQVRASFEKDGHPQSIVTVDPSGEFILDPPPPILRPQFLWADVVLSKKRAVDDHLTALFARLNTMVGALGSRPYAFAPVRTKPRRTYDPVQPLENPEGSHIPMILADTFRRDPEEWSNITAAIESFGRQSGLFDRVEVRRLGELDSDPFQIQIRIGGNSINLIDVGYGVSQVLPIIVDCLRGEEGGTFLLQQPEVHLHPSAQAELGSFLGVLAKEQNKRFVIETHSDYLVDRIRMDIRDRKGITPEDVSLLYFERRNGEAHIHELTLDDQGNILDPPPGYRNFFLEEERRFLGG